MQGAYTHDPCIVSWQDSAFANDLLTTLRMRKLSAGIPLILLQLLTLQVITTVKMMNSPLPLTQQVSTITMIEKITDSSSYC
jgi:hypothetical protein